MLFPPEEDIKRLAELMKEMKAGDPIEVSRRILALVPGFGPAYMTIGNALSSAGKLDEAEAVLWEGLQHEPCRAPIYINLAGILTARNEADVMAKRLRHLALWKLSFEDEIPKHL